MVVSRDGRRILYLNGRSSEVRRLERPSELSESDVKGALEACFDEISARVKPKDLKTEKKLR